MENIKVKDIISYLKNDVVRIVGPLTDNIYVNNVSDPSHTNKNTLDWINKRLKEKQDMAEKSPATVLVCDPTVEYTPFLEKEGKILIYVDNPRLCISKIIGGFFFKKKEPGIHFTATIDEGTEISQTAHIGAGCVIGKAKIGDGTVLMPNVVIYDNVTIGDNCLIQAGAIIGTDGLGCQREKDGTLVKFPHLGGIVIKDNVEIGANCQVARGVLSDTIIGNGCKINGLCFIAHNCVLEDNVWITGNTMLCGTVHVGKNTTIFSSVIIRDQVSIGGNVTIGMGAVVTKNVPDNETWLGAPAHKKE